MKIKYGGDSIGDDIRVEIEILENFCALTKELRPALCHGNKSRNEQD